MFAEQLTDGGDMVSLTLSVALLLSRRFLTLVEAE
jgi:hypothetical protein